MTAASFHSCYFVRTCRLQVESASAKELVDALLGNNPNLVATNAVLTCSDGVSRLAMFAGTGHAFENLGIGDKIRNAPMCSIVVWACAGVYDWLSERMSCWCPCVPFFRGIGQGFVLFTPSLSGLSACLMACPSSL